LEPFWGKGLKREAKTLLQQSIESLILSVEIFNRPHDVGRTSASLILLDHSFEMLLKAAIVHKGGKIREAREKNTIGFESCVRKCVSDAALKCLTEEQALTVQTINGLRDAAQHHILEISESQLYIHCMSGLTLYRDMISAIFGVELRSKVPERVLPLSTQPPTDLVTLFDSEVAEIKKLLAPGKRRLEEAVARLRPLAILESTIAGERSQPSDSELRAKCKLITADKSADELFPGVASIDLSAAGVGPNLALRFTKKEGIPISVVAEGTPGSYPVGIKRVNELDFYNLNLNALAEKVDLTSPRALALVQELGLQTDTECYKEIVFGSQRHKRYSQKAIAKLMEQKDQIDLEEVWERRRPRRRNEK
jgi:hypothetical protein